MSLRGKKEKAVLALMQEPTVAKAAAQTGISRATLFRWLKDPKFNDRLMEARVQASNMALLNLSELSGRATQVLREIMDEPNVNPRARVAAARTALQMAFKAMPPGQPPPGPREIGARWVDEEHESRQRGSENGSGSTDTSDQPSVISR
jgi:hypothetical protein